MLLSQILDKLPILKEYSCLIQNLDSSDDIDFPNIADYIVNLFKLYIQDIFKEEK